MTLGAASISQRSASASETGSLVQRCGSRSRSSARADSRPSGHSDSRRLILAKAASPQTAKTPGNVYVVACAQTFTQATMSGPKSSGAPWSAMAASAMTWRCASAPVCVGTRTAWPVVEEVS